MARKMKKPDELALFEGDPVNLADVRFAGTPEMLIQKEHHDTPVAYLVLGNVSELAFPRDAGGSLIRRHKVTMRRMLQIPFDRGVELFDELDRERLEGQGIHALPFPETRELEPFAD